MRDEQGTPSMLEGTWCHTCTLVCHTCPAAPSLRRGTGVLEKNPGPFVGLAVDGRE